MDTRLVEEVREYVYGNSLDATVARYAATLAGWPGEAGGIWLRVSSGKQDEANQLPEVLRHCAEHRIRPAKWYIVHGKSAFHGKHQGDLNQALADMREGEITALVIWHSDRLERRKGKALLDTLAEFSDAGGRVESVKEPQLGQADFGSQIFTFIQGMNNHEKSKHISEQVKLAQDRIRANGGVINRIPWGYITTGPKYNRTMLPDARYIRIVDGQPKHYAVDIFERCIAGDSTRTIAAWLDSEGVPTLNGNRWHEGVVWHIIRNPAYCGRRLGWADDKPLLKSEELVTVDVWVRANKALKERPKRGPIAKTNRPMLAKLKCARCDDDSPMYRIKNGYGNNRRYFYRCFGSGPRRKGCGNMVPLEQLEKIVATRMLVWNDKPHRTKQWVEGENWDSEIADATEEIRGLAQDPTADRWLERMGELQAKVVEYERKNREERTGGQWEYKNTDQTIGEYFYSLDAEGRREYLKEHDIRAEKAETDDGLTGVRLVIDGVDHGVFPYPPTLGA